MKKAKKKTESEVDGYVARINRHQSAGGLLYYMLGWSKTSADTPFFEALDEALKYFESKDA